MHNGRTLIKDDTRNAGYGLNVILDGIQKKVSTYALIKTF